MRLMSDEDGRSIDDFDDDDREQKRRFERAVPEVLRRVIERAVVSSIDKLTEAPDNLRDLVGDLKLPKEAMHYVYGQVDDTKKGIYRIVAKEIRDVLENLNFSDEVADVLTKLSFEVNTTIRFVPNDGKAETDDDEAANSGDDESQKNAKRPSKIPRPKVVSKVVMKAVDRLDPRNNKEG